MNPVLLIAKKRDGHELTAREIRHAIERFTAGELPDYQMSALAMAIFWRGMNAAETAALTTAMVDSGEVLSWPEGPPVVDKHSTGGVGDKTSLVLTPLLACSGLRVPKLSGRGLGATGGTLDKLEAIPGYRTNLDTREIHEQVARIGCVITGTTANLAPADKKLYALRDVTATVESIPLICASIMSKKLAEGLEALVLDVKFGSGAFMKSLEHAQQLAEALVANGQRAGVATTAVITDMQQPLGRMCGNAVEVNEALEVLRGAGPADVREVSLVLGAELLVAAKVAGNLPSAREVLEAHLTSGAALAKFEEMVRAQQGDLQAPRRIAPEYVVRAERGGNVQAIDAHALGLVIRELGGGRRELGETINHAVGLELLAKVGDKVRPGNGLVRLLADGDATLAAQHAQQAVTLGDAPSAKLELIVERRRA
jgi:pyrimidine-nucleoside phosphorylase